MRQGSDESPITIAEVCFSSSWGGLEHYFANCTQLLSKRGCRVISFLHPDSPAVEAMDDAGLVNHTLKPGDYVSPLTTLRLVKLFRKYRIDTIHLHRTQDLGIVIPAADIARVKTRVLTLQMESNRRKRDLYHRYVYGRLDKVLTITERMRKLVVENVAIDAGKVQTLYYGVDVDRLRGDAVQSEEIRIDWGVSPETFTVGLVGRLEPNKGQRILLEAARILADKIPGLTVILVGDETVGQQGELFRLMEFARSIEPGVRTVFTGYQHPPGSIVPAFDVSVLASRKETFGLVVIEAMALGVPVIASNAGGVPEIIDPGVDGLLVTPEHAESLAKALLRLYEDRELRSKLGAAGVRKVRDRFSIDRHIIDLLKALTGTSL